MVSPYNRHPDPLADRSIDPAARQVLAKAEREGVATAWDRHRRQQPLCGFGDLGLCCHICIMGPCRVDPFGEGPDRGACGAERDLIVARNFARAVAAGAAAHSDHGRALVEVLRHSAESGFASGYALASPQRLAALASELGVAAEGSGPAHGLADGLADGTARGTTAGTMAAATVGSTPGTPDTLALAVAAALAAQFGAQQGPLAPLRHAPEGQRTRWQRLGIVPRGIDREIVELLHRTHQGVEADPVALLRAAMRTALADGWGGSMIATWVQDLLFSGPRAIRSAANLGVLDAAQVNILCHGHEPVLSEMIVRASREEELRQQARQAGASGINVAGICCTANEILMRQGTPVAGNYLHQELALLTGAVDLMVVDVQCVMPSLPQVAACHHTEVVTTSQKADIPGAVRMPFEATRARETAHEIVRRAIAAFGRRDPSRVEVPAARSELVAGFTNENLPRYLGGRLRAGYRPLCDAIAAGRIRGVAGVVGCNTVRFVQDAHHLTLVRALIARDVLCVQTGCSAIASAKAGLLRPEAAFEHAGPGLREVCEAVGIPPVLHLGSCVDNSRILLVCAALCAEGGIGRDLAELPVVAAAPEAMSEKAMTIGLYAVASGLFTVFMPPPHVAGSARVRHYLEEEVEAETGGRFLFTEDIEQATRTIVELLDRKRAALKLAPMLHRGGTAVEAGAGAGAGGGGGAGATSGGGGGGSGAAQRVLTAYQPPSGVVALGCGKAQARSQSRPPGE